ncbi:HNH endonuclease [Mixta calida]|nr:HNH endonuclease [Mixta calida]
MERMEASSIDQVEQRILSYIAAGDIFEEGRDIQAIKSDLSIDDTTRHQLVAARAGQGWFRSECMKIFPSCPLTGISFTALLRASHIKLWRACQSGFERLDPFNGIMLAVHIDVLFDKGYISFTNSGELLISVELDENLLQQMKISVTKVPAFSANAHKYLEWHREKLFRG